MTCCTTSLAASGPKRSTRDIIAPGTAERWPTKTATAVTRIIHSASAGMDPTSWISGASTQKMATRISHPSTWTVNTEPISASVGRSRF
jgi:hypothetical protein